MNDLLEISQACRDANRIADKLRPIDAPRTSRRPFLSPRQQQVLNFARDFLGRNDEFPPMHAISRHFGWSSTNAAQEHIDALAKKGMIERNEIGNWRFARVPR